MLNKMSVYVVLLVKKGFIFLINVLCKLDPKFRNTDTQILGQNQTMFELITVQDAQKSIFF